MNTLRFPLVFLLFLAIPAIADEAPAGKPAGDESVALLSIEDIHQDAAVLGTHRLVSTGQPDRAVIDALHAAGFAAVIDMRTDSEDRGIDEESAVLESGMQYVNIPVEGPDDVTFDNARKLDEVLDAIDGPVLMHCASGNRVGALVALRASLHGASTDDALSAGKAAGLTRLEPVVEERLQEGQR